MAGFFSKLFGGGSDKPAAGETPRIGAAKAAPSGSPVDAVRAKEAQWNVVSLTQPVPYYELGDITIVDADRYFFVDVPEDLKADFRAKNPEIVFNRDKSFDGFHYYSDIPMRSGIYDLVERINHHRQLAAQEWLASGEIPVNRPRLGVLHINPYGTSGHAGKNALELQIFRTDEFTHRVFRAVYKELQAADHEMLTMKTATEVNRYNAFLTELKVHAWVTLPKGGEAIVPGGQQPVGATLVSELMEADLQSGTSKFSLAKWLSRSLAEVTGTEQGAISGLEGSIRGYELFVDKADYSVCLTASVAAPENLGPVLAEKAVPFTGDDVARLIQQPMNPTGEYTLRLVAARKGFDLGGMG